MTATLYDQYLPDDPEIPAFNQVLDMNPDLIAYLLDGDWRTQELGDTAILALAFEVDKDHYTLPPSQIPTVEQIEADIDAGIVPLEIPESRHTKREDEDEPVEEEHEEAALFNEDNRDS